MLLPEIAKAASLFFYPGGISPEGRPAGTGIASLRKGGRARYLYRLRISGDSCLGRYADQFGRYVFAPGAIEQSTPCIDKLQLTYRNIDFSFVPVDLWSTFIDALARHSRVFRGAKQATLKTRASWLFRADLKRDFSSGKNQRGCRGELKLDFNPTRILQALGPSLQTQRIDNFLADPAKVLFVPKRLSEKLRQARELTLNAADNFITDDVAQKPGLGQAFPQCTVIITRAIRALVMRDVARALSEDGRFDRVSEAATHRMFETARWHIGQCEFYWEFRTPNAIEKVHAALPHFATVMPDTTTHPFHSREGWDGNSRYVASRLDHADIRGKLYAKTHDVVRFEISYDASPNSVEPKLRSRRLQNRSEGNLRDYLAEAASLATGRAVRFWKQFWEAAETTEPPERAFFLRLISAVDAACEGTSISPQHVFSLLLQRGAISMRRGELGRVAEHLVAARILRRSRLSRNNRNIQLRLQPHYAIIARRLAEVFVGDLQQNVVADPDPNIVPLRRRSYPFVYDQR